MKDNTRITNTENMQMIVKLKSKNQKRGFQALVGRRQWQRRDLPGK
jgi:hypothetical protein